MEVVDQPVYRRDYSKVATNLPVDLGQRDQVMGNLICLLLSHAIQGERPLLLIRPTIVFRCLIEMASSCLSLGQMEREMANLIILKVSKEQPNCDG